jgi:ribonuclease BN (tRNA processing enzyme)
MSGPRHGSRRLTGHRTSRAGTTIPPMSVVVPGRFRLTVLGCSNAVPHPASPASGYLVEWEETAILLDVGQGVARRLEGVLDPTSLSGVIVGHMHADHYLDLAGLRYLYPWAGRAPRRLPVHLPPGGHDRLTALADAISERPAFFDDSFDIREYDSADTLRIGPLTVRFHRSQHYVPAWAVSIEAPDGTRVVYTGDTGPSDGMVEFARGADLLLVEAALRTPAGDDPVRGHLTAEEAVDLARRGHVRAALIVHYDPTRRAELEALCEAAGPWIRTAVAGLTRTVPARATMSTVASQTVAAP